MSTKIRTHEFTEQQQQIAEIAKALGHPARIAILQVLAHKESCVCGDIVLELPLAQSTVSRHLKVLKDAGLVQGEIAPHKSCYCIDPKGWEQAQKLFGQFWDDHVNAPEEVCCN
ncbi:metalloregulator ArsR/SmtB family transcription factor [Pontibacter sp. G13]|uniref:ArsR/SmtB family transcription factor n=1 Tax=Pontibacter sp. G13 TaxID=3074898 RepID=UPI00288A27FD|nr:metalloregulator ArsR/SmtB family transcription factor [Pontibacter sp. G13]WNJ20444.1 metalloregulator ArsR/SmtB family transcription factor [Pontibacter sp. G13]